MLWIKKHRRFLSTGVALLALTAAAILFGPESTPDPVFKSKRLSQWLKGYRSKSSQLETMEANDAVVRLGTNCIPMLLHLLRSEDTKPKLFLINLINRQHTIKIHYTLAEDKKIEAMEGFRILGSHASNAVPDLIKICKAESSKNILMFSIFGDIGPSATNALPILLNALKQQTNAVERASAAVALGKIKAQPELVVPQLISTMSEEDVRMRGFVVIALGSFETDAKPATGNLLRLVRVPDSHLNTLVCVSLSHIWDNPEFRSFQPTLHVDHEKLLADIIHQFGLMGTNAAPAIPAIAEFLNDTNELVRISATNALKRISAN